MNITFTNRPINADTVYKHFRSLVETYTKPDIDSWCKEKGILTPLQSESPCDFCNQEGAFLRCGQCYTHYYCNRECQKKHWSEHKQDCMIMKQRREIITKCLRELETVETSYGENAGVACAICFEVVPTTEQIQLPCHHMFCMSCMVNYHLLNPGQLKCPLCRSEKETNLVQHTVEKASYFIQRAPFFPEESKTRHHVIQCTRREFDRLHSLIALKRFTMSKMFYIDFAYVRLLFYEGKYDEVITRAKKLLALPQLSLSQQDRTSVVVRIAQSHEKLSQYEQAYELTQVLMHDKEKELDARTLEDDDIRDFYGVMIRCSYYTGEYETGLQYCFIMRKMGKYYNNLNEYASYCYRELHRWDEALAVMRKAIRYVEPWNPEMTKKYKDLYEKLLKERETLHEDDLKPE
jgi:tetratricopeptide (TPR) repeat protein